MKPEVILLLLLLLVIQGGILFFVCNLRGYAGEFSTKNQDILRELQKIVDLHQTMEKNPDSKQWITHTELLELLERFKKDLDQLLGDR